jgi:fatty acid desaturase
MKERGILKYSADFRTLSFAALCFVSYASQWSYRDIDAETSVPFLTFELVTSMQSFQQAVSVHNFCHVKPFTSAQLNNAFGVILTLLSGAPASLYVPGHIETHHRAPESDIDVMRTTQMTHRRPWVNLLLFFPSVLPGIIRNDLEYMSNQRQKQSALYRQYVIENSILHLTLLTLAFIDWRKMLYVYFLPTLIGKGMIVTLNLLQHGGCDVTTKYNGARNFTGTILNYLLFENGFHQVHHIYTQTSCRTTLSTLYGRPISFRTVVTIVDPVR